MTSRFCVPYDPRYDNVASLSSMPPSPGLLPPVAPPRPLFGYIQDWNEYCPPCELGSTCSRLPCQTSNLKMGDIYDGIEAECNDWISMACDEAKFSVEHGGGPFGAVIVRVDNVSGRPIEYWKSHNHVELWSDPTAHAEVSTIRIACSDLSTRLGKPVFDLSNIEDPVTKAVSHCVIYSSAEPCPMCYAAINWARIPLLIFAASRFDAAQQGIDFSDEAIYEDLARPYKARQNLKVFQSSCANSLDAFNLWKRMNKVPY